MRALAASDGTGKKLQTREVWSFFVTNLDPPSRIVIQCAKLGVVMDRRLWALRFIGVGWYVAFCIVLGAGGGRWLDGKFDTTPVLTLVGVGLGTFLAFYGLYRMLVPGMNQGKRREK